MGNLLDTLREDRKKLLLVVAGLLAVGIVGFVGYTMLSGDDDVSEADEETIEFVGLEPELSVDEQVALTVEASIPTPTLEPTQDIPATIAFVAEATQAARDAEESLHMEEPAAVASGQRLTALDRRYLNDLGRPVWLTVRSQIRLSEMYTGLPADVLTLENSNEMQRVREDLNRAESMLEELGYQPRNLSPDVRDYGRYIEDMLRLVRDAHREGSLMFSKIDLESEAYGELGDSVRNEIDTIYYGVGEKLYRFERDMMRFGCSACGELYRGRGEDGI